MRAHELTEVSAEIETLQQQILSKYPDVDTLFISLHNDTIKIMSIIINKSARKAGVGSSVMQHITNYADQNGYRITLTPANKDDHHGTTSRTRLIKFYKQFGFVQNKGRNKDFAISDSMFREPKN